MFNSSPVNGKLVMMIMAMLLLATMVLTTNVASADGGSWAEIENDLTNPSAGSDGKKGPIKNLGAWIAEQLMYLYTLLVAIISVMFIVKHKYSQLAAFLVIAIIVAIPIFAPSALPTIAQAIADTLSKGQ